MMSRLEMIADQIDQQSYPPVHLWQPSQVGKIDIKIDRNGYWFHESESIGRAKLVRLFASILWFEGSDVQANGSAPNQYYLVTPVEKLAIQVEDVPYVITQTELLDGSWVVITNTQEKCLVSEQHPVRLLPYNGQLLPYVQIRYELWARVNRTVYFEWVSHALENQGDDLSSMTLFSGEYQFEVAKG